MPPRFSYEDTSAFLYIHPVETLRRPPCQAVCPAGTPVSLMNRLLAQGKKKEALAILLDITPFPEWMCECCSRPCESACNKKRHMSEPVPIARLAQLAASCLAEAEPPCALPSGCQTAVIGNDLPGLAAAYFLHRLGHSVFVMGKEENIVSGLGRAAEIRVRNYLFRHGVVFTSEIPDSRVLNTEFRAIIAGESFPELNKTKLFYWRKKWVIPLPG